MAKKVTTYEQLQRRFYFLIALILGLVVIAVGIIIELFQDRRISKIDASLQQLAIPLTPTLNAEVLDQLVNYQYVTPNQARQRIEQLPIVVIDKEGRRITRSRSEDGTIVEETESTELEQFETEEGAVVEFVPADEIPLEPPPEAVLLPAVTGPLETTQVDQVEQTASPEPSVDEGAEADEGIESAN